MKMSEVLLKEEGSILFDDRFSMNIRYPKYWNEKFAIENKEMLQKIFMKVSDDLFYRLLTDAQGLMDSLHNLKELDFVKNVSFSNRAITVFDEVTEEFERRIVNYGEDKNASISLFFHNKLNLHDIKPSFSYTSIDFTGLVLDKGCFADYIVKFEENKVFGYTKDYTIEGVFMSLYLMPKYFEEVHRVLIDDKEFVWENERDIRYLTFCTDERFKPVLEEIIKYIKEKTSKNKSKRIDGLRNSNGKTILEYAVEQKMRVFRHLFGEQLLELALEFKKPMKQIQDYFRRLDDRRIERKYAK